MKVIYLLISTLLLASCVQTPQPLRGDFSAITPREIQASGKLNQKIRWTGFVIEVENLENRSCLTVLAKVADEMGKPSRYYRADQGRFIACKKTFLEPEFFTNKPVTVTGIVRETVDKKVGQHPYKYPVVDAQVIYAW